MLIHPRNWLSLAGVLTLATTTSAQPAQKAAEVRMALLPVANRVTLVADFGAQATASEATSEADAVVIEVGPLPAAIRPADLTAPAGATLVTGVSVRPVAGDSGNRVRVRIALSGPSEHRVRTSGSRVYVDFAPPDAARPRTPVKAVTPAATADAGKTAAPLKAPTDTPKPAAAAPAPSAPPVSPAPVPAPKVAAGKPRVEPSPATAASPTDPKTPGSDAAAAPAPQPTPPAAAVLAPKVATARPRTEPRAPATVPNPATTSEARAGAAQAPASPATKAPVGAAKPAGGTDAAAAAAPSLPPMPAEMTPGDLDVAYQDLELRTLRRARELAKAPDVRGLLKLREQVEARDQQLGQKRAERVARLLTEVARLTDEARALQLERDREAMKKAKGQ